MAKTANILRIRLLLLSVTALLIISTCLVDGDDSTRQNVTIGVWDNSDFQKPADNWSEAAENFDAENGLVDLVVAQANDDGRTWLPFPFQSTQHRYSSSQIDKIEPYLQKFDSDGLKVILSVQPMNESVSQLIDILLTRYGNHTSIIGVNIDMEWKLNGTPNHVSNEESDAWLKVIKSHSSSLKLFLTYFGDYTYFPEDSKNLVILFDGEDAPQSMLLNEYEKLAEHYSSVGIYTGYPTSIPPTATNERILAAAPNTQFIIHTNVFSNNTTLIFLMSDVHADWLVNSSIDLIDLHENMSMPVVLGVIPDNFDSPDLEEDQFPGFLKDVSENKSDLFEIAEHAYPSNESDELSGMSYNDQKKIIENGLAILKSIGLKPGVLLPDVGDANEMTVKAGENLGFNNLVTFSDNLSSDKLLITNSIVSLAESINDTPVLNSPEKLMKEIDELNESVVIIIYSVQDFQPGSGNSVEQLEKILDILKKSKKYQFMTLKAYRETQPISIQAYNQSNYTEPVDNPKMPGWNLYLGLIALLVVKGSLFKRS